MRHIVTGKQTRINRNFNLQLEKILTLYHQKTECFSPSSISKKLDDSIHKEHYDRMHQKLTQNEKYAKKIVIS